MNESEIKVEYYYTESEYLVANRLYLFNSPNILARLVIFFFLVLAGSVIMALIFADTFPIWATVGLALLFEIGIVNNLFVRMPRQYFRGDGKFRDKYEVTFSDEGIFVKTPQINSKLAWSLYTRVIEGRDMYLLVYGKEIRMMTTVPKRAFKNRDEENGFRELVSRHITDHSRMKKMGADNEIEYTPTSFNPPDWR